MIEATWGFCERCELWRLVDDWERGCPECGGEPNPVEQLVDGRAVVRLVLDLPPGSELPLLS